MLPINKLFKMWILSCFLFIYASNLYIYLPPFTISLSTYFQFYMVFNCGFNTNRFFFAIRMFKGNVSNVPIDKFESLARFLNVSL